MLGAMRKTDGDMARFRGRRGAPILLGISATIISMRQTTTTNSMPDAKKYSVAVTAHSTYLPDQSDEEEDRFVFAYTIRITNTGNVSAQLVSRHWIITDADSQVQEVRGMGVVGEQPVLKPGDTFEYSSGSSIPTAVGTMRGSYQLVAEDGTRFEASIPEFTLSVPRVLH
jgi:ApaG protein